MGYRVKRDGTNARLADGSTVTLYEGNFLPDNADPEHVEFLLRDEFVEEADQPTEDEEGQPARRGKAKPKSEG